MSFCLIVDLSFGKRLLYDGTVDYSLLNSVTASPLLYFIAKYTGDESTVSAC
jgi:hypothetical protein